MFEFLGLYIIGAIAVTLCSGAAPLILHRMFGPTLPPSAQMLSDTFTSVFKAGATVFLGPVQLLRRIRISVTNTEPQNDDPKQIPKH